MDFYSVLKVIHGYLPWLLLIFLIGTLVKSVIGWFKKGSNYTQIDDKLSLITFILSHIQLLLGLGLYFGGGWYKHFSNMGETMKNADLRFMTVEHITIMILAIILISVGRIRSKKMVGSDAKHKTTAIFFGLALAGIIWGIPWDKFLGN